MRLDDGAGLSRDLGIAPVEAAMLSDAALIMLAFERWDQGAVERLYGNFALALWDPERQRLLLARDFLDSSCAVWFTFITV